MLSILSGPHCITLQSSVEYLYILSGLNGAANISVNIVVLIFSFLTHAVTLYLICSILNLSSLYNVLYM